MSARDLEPRDVQTLSDEELRAFLASAVKITEEDRKQSQILFYKPVSPKSQQFHESKGRVVAAGGGNGSAKTETMLVEVIMCATGIFPDSQRHLIEQKFRGPIQCRVTVESLTTTLEPIILPKLQWFKWVGTDRPGGDRGHWGWVPKQNLIDGEWDKSYSTKLRILRVLCRDPHNPDKVLGESSIQFMSLDQDSTDFASGDFHICAHDEPPSLAIWRENEARTMRVDGRMLLAMTWPDDPSIAVDWLYDEVYEPGRSGNDPNITWIELWTTENPHLRQEAVAAQAEKWSTEITNVRIYGRPIRFSNRVHPDFSTDTRTWCFKCGKSVVLVSEPKPHCGICESENIVDYCHVEDFSTSTTWPTVFLLDPHPRRPHDLLWIQCDPMDDWWIVAEARSEGDCVDVRTLAHSIEKDMQLTVAQRLMDPNIALAPSGQKREISWQDEFGMAGLFCELASDSDVGRSRINHYLKPDEKTMRPRMHVHTRCKDTILQFQRYVWDSYSRHVDRNVKQVPKDKNDDKPTLVKYFANSDPTFRFLQRGAPVLKRSGERRGGY